MPALQPLHHLLLCNPLLLRLPVLQLPLGQRLPCLCFLNNNGIGIGLLLRINGDEHALYAAQIGNRVFDKTPRQEGARGVPASEEVVAAARPVGLRRRRDVVDSAVESEIDGFVWVGAVVLAELDVGEAYLSLLVVVSITSRSSFLDA